MWHTYVVARDSKLRRVLHVKIGRSRDPVKRINHLQTFSPEPLRALFILEGDRENELHRRFAKYRERGEWFRVAGELRSFIEEHATTFRLHGPSFYNWLIENEQRTDDVGRLALIVKADDSFPRQVRRLCLILEYIKERYEHLRPLFKNVHRTYRYEVFK